MGDEAVQWDAVIVGGGSAGCTLAARLAADERRRVLLIEAGPRDVNLMFRIPLGNFRILGDPRYDWCYETEPEPHLNNRKLEWPRGKVLGGSSAVNGLIAIRGHPDDYDGWAAQGCNGWSWQELLPYFIRLEDFEPGASELHGVGGSLPLSTARGRHPICDAYLKAAQDCLGLSETRDHNGPSQDGAGYYHVNVSRGLIPTRVSAARAYLHKRRPNLQIVTGSRVERITFSGRRATAVIYEAGGFIRMARARKVVLAAGVIGSPQLLQTSGIGDPRLLRSLGIEVVRAAPAVGENLQDHLQTWIVHRVNVKTVNDKVRTIFGKFRTAFEGLLMQTGAYYGVTNFGMFVRTEPGLSRPDTQFHIHPASGSFREPHPFSGVTIGACHLRPQSRGSVRIRSSDPRVPPAIQANYLEAELDRQVMVRILKICRRLADHPAVSGYIVEERQPGPAVQTDTALLDYVRNYSGTTYHPVGTCRMGADPDAVVDERLRVRGVDGLYVVDASIMPTIISGNTHVPTVMIGEKAADMIVEDERS
jgi:choline dehydrogenase